MNQVIPSKCENAKWSIRFVRLFLMHRGTPEVVVEDILEGRVGPEVTIILDRRDIVEDETATEAVEVHGERGYSHDRRECSPRRHSHHK